MNKIKVKKTEEEKPIELKPMKPIIPSKKVVFSDSLPPKEEIKEEEEEKIESIEPSEEEEPEIEEEEEDEEDEGEDLSDLSETEQLEEALISIEELDKKLEVNFNLVNARIDECVKWDHIYDLAIGLLVGFCISKVIINFIE